MDRILRQTKIEMIAVEEHHLGVLGHELTAFKAALLFCPNLKAVAEPVLGWPLFAVMPCRDFVYVLNCKDEPLLGRMGHVVMREYRESGYPITTEVFELSDRGMRVVGDYQASEPAEAADAGGMKAIRYRGGLVNFRIPAHWTEEYQEEGGGTFYDPDNDDGTLRLNVLTLASKSPVTTRSAWTLLEPRREQHQGVLADLGDGNALLRYTETVEEDGDDLVIHSWQIANVVPPKHLRVAVFSYTVSAELADDEDVAAEIAMLDKELKACTFAKELGS
jgi:hypothetical protein